MPLIDMAVWVKGSNYTSAPFTNCLQALGYTQGEGMMNAIEFFTAMNNNAFYCPTMTVNEAGFLEMSWDNDPFALLLTLGDGKDDITYVLTEKGKRHDPVETTHDQAHTLVEYWAAFLSQGNSPESQDGRSGKVSDVPSDEGRKAKGKGRRHQP